MKGGVELDISQLEGVVFDIVTNYFVSPRLQIKQVHLTKRNTRLTDLQMVYSGTSLLRSALGLCKYDLNSKVVILVTLISYTLVWGNNLDLS